MATRLYCSHLPVMIKKKVLIIFKRQAEETNFMTKLNNYYNDLDTNFKQCANGKKRFWLFYVEAIFS